MDLETPVRHSRVGLIVIVLVLLGIGVLGAGAYVAIKHKNSESPVEASGASTAETEQWCQIRKEWADKVNGLSGDIMLKSAKPSDAAEAKKLIGDRHSLCQQYAKKISTLQITDPRIAAVEEALIKEGKVRANISIEIHNILAPLATLAAPQVREALDEMKVKMASRIKQGRDVADKEIAQALSLITGCTGIYRGPMTDEGTADDPYVSWDELEFRRGVAESQIQAKMAELEPQEAMINQIYHELLRKYRVPLKQCYQQALKKSPDLAAKFDIGIRLRADGKVQTLTVSQSGKAVLDCLLRMAESWELPRPEKAGEYIQINVDWKSL